MNIDLKLELLKRYMAYFIQEDGQRLSFYDWVLTRRPRYVKGTAEYSRSVATHCYYCGKEFKGIKGRTIDHFYPTSKGGKNNTTENALVICCENCNLLKRNIHPRVLLHHLTKSVLGKNINPLYGKKTKKVFESVSHISNAFKYGQQNKLYYKQQFRIKKAPYIFELNEK